MSTLTTSIYAYPWDLLDEGIDQALDTIAALGVDAVHVSMSYHSGKFISPRSPRRRVYFPEGGVIYFKMPELRGFESPIKPVESSLGKLEEFVSRLAEGSRERGLKLVAWVVGTHNTRLGQEHPEYTVKNAYGDSYPYALCPGNEATRNYVKSIVVGLIQMRVFDAIEVESIAYLGFLHGYHHEFYGVKLGVFEQSLLALCFCSSCQLLARKAEVDALSLRTLVSKTLDYRLNRHFDDEASPSASCDELMDFVSANEPLELFIRERCELVTGLIADLVETVHRRDKQFYCDGPIFIQPATLSWVEGLEVTKIGQLVDRYDVTFTSDDMTNMDLDCPIGACINVSHPQTRDYSQLANEVSIAIKRGFSNISFYNYGMLPDHRLLWIEDTIQSLRGERD